MEYPYHRKINEIARAIHTFRKIWELPGLDRSEIVAYQNKKLRSIISYSYQHVPYYRELFDNSGITPDDIKSSKDLSLIPITTSQEYRSRSIDEVISDTVDYRRMVERHTSGTTGRPFVIRRTHLEDHLINFFRIRAHKMLGMKTSDITAYVGFVSKSHRKDNLLGSIRHALGIYKTYPIDCLGSPSEILSGIEKVAPDIIMGFPGVLANAARFIEDGKMNGYPRFLISGGETLTPYRKKAIEQGFQSTVYDMYGAHEFNMLAWECKTTGEYHVCDDNVIFEVLNNGRTAKPGEAGEVVVTGLHSYAMPFLRYRLGDTVTQGSELCSCGLPFSTISTIQGRRNDYFKMPDGQLFHPDKIIVPIMEHESEWFDQYQVIQIQKNSIVMKICPTSKPDETRLNHVKELARTVLPENVKFNVELVERSAFETTVKNRYCRSLVNSEP